jgi:hypothetical protein
MQQRDHHMAHDQDGQIGRAVIRAVVVKFLTAGGAVMLNRQIPFEQFATATARAIAAPSAA